MSMYDYMAGITKDPFKYTNKRKPSRPKPTKTESSFKNLYTQNTPKGNYTDQDFALGVMNGKPLFHSGYVSPSQTGELMIQAQTPINKVNTSKKPSGNAVGSGGGAAYNAYAAAIERQNQLMRQQQEMLRQQQELMRQQRETRMNATIDANNVNAEKSMTEAYIQNMLTKKNLPQQLKSVGVSGGATESTLSDIENTYMNNRMAIDKGRLDANARARMAYDEGVNGDYQKYLAQKFNLESANVQNQVEMAGSMMSNSNKKNKPTGYQIEGSSKVHSGSDQEIVDGIITELKDLGMTEAQVKAYLKSAGWYK